MQYIAFRPKGEVCHRSDLTKCVSPQKADLTNVFGCLRQQGFVIAPTSDFLAEVAPELQREEAAPSALKGDGAASNVPKRELAAPSLLKGDGAAIADPLLSVRRPPKYLPPM